MAKFNMNYLFNTLPVAGQFGEAKIEEYAEWFFNKLDKCFLDPECGISQADYDRHVSSFRAWESKMRANGYRL